jgi:hypothetical protein
MEKGLITMANQGKDGRFLPGNQGNLKHGLYAKKIPVPGKRKLQRYLNDLEKDLNETIPDPTPQQRMLISQAVRAEGIQRTIEIYLHGAGLLDPVKYRKYGKLESQPVMREYFQAINAQRAALTSLGIEKRHTEKELDLHEYIAMKDAENKAASDAETGGDANRGKTGSKSGDK